MAAAYINILDKIIINNYQLVMWGQCVDGCKVKRHVPYLSFSVLLSWPVLDIWTLLIFSIIFNS